jgi:hypothetical protein
MCAASGLLVVIIVLVFLLLCKKMYRYRRPACNKPLPAGSSCDCPKEGLIIQEEEQEEGFTQSADLIGMSHEDAIKKMGLEDDVVKSHERFVKEMDHKTTTASKQTIHDSFNPPVQFWGLPRKSHYARLGADSTSRTVQTETPEQTLSYALHSNSRYCL